MAFHAVFPEDVAREVYNAALEKCTFGSGWLFTLKTKIGQGLN